MNTASVSILSFLLGALTCGLLLLNQQNDCRPVGLPTTSTTTISSSNEMEDISPKINNNAGDNNNKFKRSFTAANVEKEEAFLSLESLVFDYLSNPEYHSLRLVRNDDGNNKEGGKVTAHMSHSDENNDDSKITVVVADPASEYYPQDQPTQKNNNRARNLGVVGVKRLRKRVKNLSGYKDVLEALPNLLDSNLMGPLNADLDDVVDTLNAIDSIADNLPVELKDILDYTNAVNMDDFVSGIPPGTRRRELLAADDNNSAPQEEEQPANDDNGSLVTTTDRKLQEVDLDVLRTMVEEANEVVSKQMGDISVSSNQIRNLVDTIREVADDAQDLLGNVSKFKPS